MPNLARKAPPGLIRNSSPAASPGNRTQSWIGLALFLVTFCLYAAIPYLPSYNPTYLHWHSLDLHERRQMYFRYAILFFGILPASFLLQPRLSALVKRLSPRRRRGMVSIALAGVCLCLSIALVRIGRHQFGGFDYSALLEVGWRQTLGQRMYLDFLTPTPPGFNLGVKYAMFFFGPTWDATLYLNCIFGCITLLWIYWLLRVQRLSPSIAGLVALSIECQTVLLLGFWWYNDTVEVLSAIFLLTCLAYLTRPTSKAVATSYVVCFALLALMKPNIAGPTIVFGVALLFLAVRNRTRLAWLTCGAAALLALIFLSNHISLPAMMESYREVAKERGGFGAVGWFQMDRLDRATAMLGMIVLILPGICLVPLVRDRFRAKQWHAIAPLLFFPVALLLSVYGLMSNGEFWQVECAPLVAVLAVLIFSNGNQNYQSWMRRAALAVLCADMAANIYLGAIRYRVFTIGPYQFFEWSDNEHAIAAGPLRHMRVSRIMMEMQDQITAAVTSNAGPFYFGPRVNYSYFAQGLPSPTHFPAWWHPGTSFGRDQEPGLIQVWKQKRFETLIFLKNDYSYYPPEFLSLIHNDYLRDDTYPRLTIYRRRH